MTPVSSETGQAVQLILMDEVVPMRGGAFLPDLTAKVTKRYRFEAYPTDFTQTSPVAKFQIGLIQTRENTIPISSLEIYNDGILVNARHTDDADMILDDFMRWSLNEFGFREPLTKIPRRYLSAVVVDFERSFDSVIANFGKISEIVSRAFKIDESVVFQRFAVRGDPIHQVGHRTWQIEPRIVSQPFVPNRYFSSAHLRTSEHFEMLAELENLT